MNLLSYFDMINAAFEIGGALINWMNVVEIKRSKEVKGVHVAPFIFFTSWGAWNILFYSALEQPYSVAASMLLAVVNGTWVYYFFKFRGYKNGKARKEIHS